MQLWPDKYSTLTITILLKQGGGGGAGEGGAKEQGSQGARKLKQNCRLRTVCAVVGQACQACQADSEHQKRSRIAGLLVHPPGLKIRQGTCTVSGPVLAETRVDDPGWGGWGGYGDALTPFRSPGASTGAEDSPEDVNRVRACARTAAY